MQYQTLSYKEVIGFSHFRVVPAEKNRDGGAKMIYLNTERLAELVAKNQTDFCKQAKISKQVMYRILNHGGPVMIATAIKVSTALGVPPASLLDHTRTSGRDAMRL